MYESRLGSKVKRVLRASCNRFESSWYLIVANCETSCPLGTIRKHPPCLALQTLLRILIQVRRTIPLFMLAPTGLGNAEKGFPASQYHSLTNSISLGE